MESRLVCSNVGRLRLVVSDRLLEVTGTISATGDNKQVLDKLKVERDRGTRYHFLAHSRNYCKSTDC
jgi:translation elongation factor EF-4